MEIPTGVGSWLGAMVETHPVMAKMVPDFSDTCRRQPWHRYGRRAPTIA